MKILQGVLAAGWRIVQAPANGALLRNGQIVVMKHKGHQFRLRIFGYKVTQSSRGRPEERRIEITSTYEKGLPKPNGIQDVVIGVDPEKVMFVGVDPRRIAYGGPTGNASSFFDRAGLDWKSDDEILVLPHSARVFEDGIEYHAFMKSTCLAEYLQNLESIHNGKYIARRIMTRRGKANFLIPEGMAKDSDLVVSEASGVRARKRRVAKQSLVSAIEAGKAGQVRNAKLGKAEFAELMKLCQENGFLGEQFVIEFERKRLRRLHKPNLAEDVKWVSQIYPFAGFDILSHETSGMERLIEVKATIGSGTTFPMSANEWEKAVEIGSSYCIYRVLNVRKDPKVFMLRDPAALESAGAVKKVPWGWLVTAKQLEPIE